MNFLIKLFKGMYHFFALPKPEPYQRYIPMPAGPRPVPNPNLSDEENQQRLLKWIDRNVNPPIIDRGPEVMIAVCDFGTDDE